MIVPWDVLSVTGLIQTTGGSECGDPRVMHAQNTDVWIALHRTLEGESESCWRRDRMDCSRVGWSTDSHSFQFATQTKQFGRVRNITDGGANLHAPGTQELLILGGDFNVTLHGVSDRVLVGRGNTCPGRKTNQTTTHSIRARALHAAITDMVLMVTTTWVEDQSRGKSCEKLWCTGHYETWWCQAYEHREASSRRREKTLGTGGNTRMHMVQFQ